MTANSLKSLLRQYDVVVEIIAMELLLQDPSSSTSHLESTIDNVVSINDSMIAMAAFHPNGEPYIASSNIKNNSPFNLLEYSSTRESFLETLKTDKLTLGRTYYNEALNQLILPVRKSIRDSKGNTVFVISAAIDLEKGFDFFINNSKDNQLYDTFLFREKDRYFQIAPKNSSLSKEIYNYQIAQADINSSINQLLRNTPYTYNELKENEIVVANIEKHSGKMVQSGSVYLKSYDLWLTTRTPLQTIYNKILSNISKLIFLFFTSILIIYFLFRTISKNEEKKQKALQHQANNDYLTQLHNRYFLDNHYKNLDKKTPFSIIFIDLDNFKYINDTYGHDYGDRVLQNVSIRLAATSKKGDKIIRYSGDEFILIHSKVDKKSIKLLCSEILYQIHQPYDLDNLTFTLTASIGVSRYPEDGDSFDEIKRYADLALYQSKNNRNCFTLFEEKIKAAYSKKNIIEAQLKSPELENELYILYQPQVSKNGKLIGVEALLRWKSKSLGLIPPGTFIEIAENIGIMPSIGRFVLEKSMSELSILSKTTNTNINLSINISVKQLLDENFLKIINSIIKSLNYNRSLLTLEITESVLIDDIERTKKILLKLKKSGIKLSLDDFGTGYSSLSILKTLPVDELKVDKIFIDDILYNKSSLPFVKGIISLGHQLEKTVIAEGVEEIEQVTALTKLGCNYFQGYYFSRPLSFEQLTKYISFQSPQNRHTTDDMDP